MIYRLKVIRSGTGLFASLPAALVRELGVREKDALLGEVKAGQLVATPVTLNAQALIEALTEDNQHAGDT